MDKFKRAEKDVSDDFGKYLANDLISFVNSHGKLDLCSPMAQPFSHCIQIVEPYAHVPVLVEKKCTFRKIRLYQ
jgi:hypothetical protein